MAKYNCQNSCTQGYRNSRYGVQFLELSQLSKSECSDQKVVPLLQPRQQWYFYGEDKVLPEVVRRLQLFSRLPCTGGSRRYIAESNKWVSTVGHTENCCGSQGPWWHMHIQNTARNNNNLYWHCLWLIWCIAEVVMEHIWNLNGSLNKAISNFILVMLSRWLLFKNFMYQFWPFLDILPPWWLHHCQ